LFEEVLPGAHLLPDQAQGLEPFQVEIAFVSFFRVTREAILLQKRLDVLDVALAQIAAGDRVPPVQDTRGKIDDGQSDSTAGNRQPYEQGVPLHRRAPVRCSWLSRGARNGPEAVRRIAGPPSCVRRRRPLPTPRSA